MLVPEIVDFNRLIEVFEQNDNSSDDVEIARSLIYSLADLGHPDALFTSAMWSLDREYGFDLNELEALNYLQHACDRGHPSAAFNLGILHEIGKFVPLDIGKSAEYYLKAAFRGNSKALEEVSNSDSVVSEYLEAGLWREVARSEFLRLSE